MYISCHFSDVDNNVEYDSLDIREQDEEERYFDRESDEEIADDIAEWIEGVNYSKEWDKEAEDISPETAKSGQKLPYSIIDFK